METDGDESVESSAQVDEASTETPAACGGRTSSYEIPQTGVYRHLRPTCITLSDMDLGMNSYEGPLSMLEPQASESPTPENDTQGSTSDAADSASYVSTGSCDESDHRPSNGSTDWLIMPSRLSHVENILCYLANSIWSKISGLADSLNAIKYWPGKGVSDG